MSVQGPQFDSFYRIQPISNSDKEKDEGKKQKKGVSYQGRIWEESDDNQLPIGDKIPQKKVVIEEKEKKKSKSLFIEALLLEKACKLFEKLTTLEDKVAQLIFFKTEATYDPAIQNELSSLIRQWQFGGIVFLKGSYKREAYLIEHYQGFAKIPLLMGNDFTHNLSFYFQDGFPEESFSSQCCRDLGKAVMGQNRSLGVHFLFDREEAVQLPLSNEQKQSFRKGVRQAQGIVARDLLPSKGIHKIKESDVTLLKSSNLPASESLKQKSAEQFIGMRTLFLKETSFERDSLVKAFNEGYEAFLIESSLSAAITALVEAVKEGAILEEELDKRVLKILVIKSYN